MSSKDIWGLLSAVENASKVLTPRRDDDAAKAEEKDTFTLIVGEKGAGKTSLTANFRNSSKAEEIKPTTALDYVFVRLKAGANGSRPPVAHMWELATSKCIGDMIRIPLAPERVLNGALVIVLDLSTPGDVVPSLVKWLIVLQRVVSEILKAKEKNPVDKFAVDRLRQEAMTSRYGTAHPDKDDVVPIALPVLIVGNKYDAFRDEDPVKRKGLLQAVRYLAHLYGASVLFTSMKDKALVSQFRSVMKAFAFRCMPKGASKEVDPAKPLFVPAGADLFEDIGMPKTGRRHDQFTREQHEDRARQWKKIATEYFAPSGLVTDPDEKSEGKADEDDRLSAADKFPEPKIDRVRQQKSEELRRYRESRKKAMERKTKAA